MLKLKEYINYIWKKLYWVTSEINKGQKSQSTGNMKETIIYRNVNEEKNFCSCEGKQNDCSVNCHSTHAPWRHNQGWVNFCPVEI